MSVHTPKFRGSVSVTKSTGEFVTDRPITQYDSEESAIYELAGDSGLHAHDVECEIQRVLTWDLHLNWEGLVIRRVQGGVALQGILHIDDSLPLPDLKKLIKKLTGVNVVSCEIKIRSSDFEINQQEGSIMPWNG